MVNTITISVPQPICLLGDLTSDFDFNTVNITAGMPILLTLTKLETKTSLLHFIQDDVHVEFNQLTPIIPQGTRSVNCRLINLTHNLLLQLQMPFGIDLKVDIPRVLTEEKVLASYMVGLWQALAQLQKTDISKQELLTSCLAYAKQAGFELDWHDCAAAVYGGINYCHSQKQTVQTFSLKNLKLYYLAVNTALPSKLYKDIYHHIQQNAKRYSANFAQISKLSDLGAVALAKQDIAKLGEYCNRTQKLLNDFGLITDEVHHLCVQANLNGAMGAKYSHELKAILVICDQRAVEVKARLMKQNLKVEEIDIN